MAEETPVDTGTSAPGPTAGSLLRRAREAQGMHIAVLAASLKVPQRKLEALERDRLDELPDATFARALAQAMCRALKIDPAPVLDLLPRAGAGAAALDQVSAGLNTPFRDKPTAVEPAVGLVLRHPATVIVVVLLVAALALWFWPRTAADPVPTTPPVAEILPAPTAATEPASAASSASAALTVVSEPAASAPPAGSLPSGETVHSAPDSAASVSADGAAPVALLSLRADGETWVQVADAAGQTLLSRTVQAGERVGLDGTPPLRLTIGNASATEVLFRGRAVDLQAATRDNVARIELR